MSNFTMWVESLGWMLIHSLWMVAFIVGVASLTLRLLREQSANSRYVVGCVALLFSLAVMPVSLVYLIAAYPEIHSATSIVPPEMSDRVTRPKQESDPIADLETPQVTELPGIEIVAPPLATAETIQPDEKLSHRRPVAFPGEHRSFSMTSDSIRPHLIWLVGTWTLGVLVLSLRPLIGWWHIRRLRRSGLTNVSDDVRQTVADLAQRLRIRKLVSVFQSTLVEVPCVIGAWKPVILLPAAVLTGLTTDQLEAVLAHELAHIRRHDFVINIIQTLVETLLFYHPAIWWLSSRIRQEREHCCDDQAIAMLEDIAGYATMLLSVERLRGKILPTTVAAGGGSLVERIRRLTNSPAVESRSPAMSLIVLSTVLAIAGSWTWSSAQTKQTETDETRKPAQAQESRDQSKASKAANLLVLINAQEKPVGGTVHVGNVGYTSDPQKLLSWETNRHGEIELTGLAAGKHTFVADASTDAPTIFQIELPAEILPIRQRLNPHIELKSVNGIDPLEIRTKLNTRNGQTIIDVEFTNKTDQPINLPLLSMVDSNLRVFIPKKLVADDTTIPPHRTRSIPLNWTRIVKGGVWTSRNLEAIDEPWPAKPAGDGLQYFRLDVGHIGTWPLALPKPELVLERPEVANIDPTPITQPVTREFPLGNFGGVPQRGSYPAPMSPEARPTADNTTPWIDAEYFLQYRIRIANNGSGYQGKAATPLLLLDIRNTGKLELALEKVQSRHEVLVDQVNYFRDDQPWGGIDPIDESGVCIPFLLTSDWKSRPIKGEAGLSLQAGSHAVAIQIRLHETRRNETGRNADGQLIIEPRGGRVLLTRPINIEIHDPETDQTRAIALENIRRELVVFPRFFAPKVSANLQQLVRSTQPESGDFLLKSLGPGNMTAPDPASFIIAQTWDDLSRAQREQYLKSSMIHFAELRPTYPQGVDAGVAVGPRFASDYAGLPAGKPEMKSKTVTTHFLDGQQAGKPMTYALHTTISHWFRTGSLPLGKHSIRMVTEYEFQRESESYVGKFETERTFEIVPKGLDLLVARSDPVVDNFVYRSIEIVEASATTNWGGRGWQPQIRWNSTDSLRRGSLHTPSWKVTQPLPVDLCFRSELQLEEADESIPGSEIVVPAGQVVGFYFRPTNSDSYQILKNHADAEGFVKTRLILTPSQGVALSDSRIKHYFGGTITSDVVRVRVDRDEIGKEFEESPGNKP